MFRLAGAAIIVAATASYFLALRHLGQNYSPCYDSHVPHELICSGPYTHVRHPMYVAKLLLSFGIIVLTGSLWFVPPFLYLSLDMMRSMRSEEKYLASSCPDYEAYRKKTRMMVPFLL